MLSNLYYFMALFMRGKYEWPLAENLRQFQAVVSKLRISTRYPFWWSVRVRGINFPATLFIHKSSVKIRWTELQENPLPDDSWSIVNRWYVSTSSRIFLRFLSILAANGRPEWSLFVTAFVHLWFSHSGIFVSCFQHWNSFSNKRLRNKIS